MNAQARALGLRRTRYRDPSGVSARTVSTAGDQVRIAMQALEIPAFRRIVAMRQVTLPVAGPQYNLNGLLGTDGIVGVKTGSTSRAGGCFVFAARRDVAGRTVTVVGAVLHQLPSATQPSVIGAAFSASTALLASAHRALLTRPVVHRHATVGWVEAPWAAPVAVVATRAPSLFGWPGLPIHAAIISAPGLTTPIDRGRSVGTAVVTAGEEQVRVRVVATQPLPGPSLTWRLAHPLP
jgi:D-alanyl-D-alanine carboxypeptidase (penicillin-binding protein 5/6)